MGLAAMQEHLEGLQREVQALKQRLQQQQEYCSSHHVYDTTSPLITADMILQAPASAADAAAAGLVDMAQQVRWLRCGSACAQPRCDGTRFTLLQILRGVAVMSLNEELGMPGKKEQELLKRQLSCVQQLLAQIAAGAHDLSTCVQRAAHLKCHPSLKHA